ncbi:Lrp/AsnC family transcriptional regulator [Candidatus Woesearchaeota archaeon]|nr:MAG: Lrp/AsnC family transcriptional regulator [Candidatus Woesearchaeota archaeon]
MPLDLLDRKLLYELDSNSRKPINQIAKKLRINRTVAAYRIDRLKKEGIIKGTYTQINNFSLKYYSFRMFIKLGNFTEDKESSLINNLVKEKKLLWLARVLGKWDIDLIYMTKSIFEFDTFQKNLLLKYNDIIEEYQTALLTKINDYPKDYLINKERTPLSLKKSIKESSFEPDGLHEKILFYLSENASMNIIHLGQKVGASTNTVKKKMKELIRNKIILAFRLFIDTNKLGYQYYKLHLTLRHYREKDLYELTSFLESKNFMISTDHYLGGEHFEIELHIATEKEYIDFISELMKRYGKIIKDHYVIKFYKELTYRYLPVIDTA